MTTIAFGTETLGNTDTIDGDEYAPDTVEDAAPADEKTGAPKSSSESKTKAASRQRDRDRVTRANYREGARKMLELQAAGPEVQAVVASIASCENELVELSVALCGPRAAISGVIKVLEDVLAEMEADPLQAGIRIMGMITEDRKSLWNLLVSTGAALPARYPANDMKASSELAKAIQSLTASDRELLSKASELAG